ncbi:polysaccharide biosynthesis tyrosine autokinase [Ideonella sp.]|uniref:polysaccharide biosynthesis tyrosine autokinase n=1 Tax=Ideonella sp. TaxID=1929293 RepID=UPI003BB643D4
MNASQDDTALSLSQRMGQAFLDSGKLSQADIEDIVRLQARVQIRFGEAAVRLGYLTEADVEQVLARQFNYQTASNTEFPDHPIDHQLLIAHKPQSPQAEAMRRFRAEVMLRLDGSGRAEGARLAVVSPDEGDGRSHVAASLAIALAQQHIKTLLIDANLRKPRLHQCFELDNKTGLSSMLAGRSEPSMASGVPVMADLRVLTSGPVPPNPIEILSGPGFGRLLEQLAGEVQVIVLDTPAMAQGADAQVIAQACGQAVLVGREGRTRVAALQHALDDLASARVQVLGSFYNNPQRLAATGPAWLQGLRAALRRARG